MSRKQHQALHQSYPEKAELSMSPLDQGLGAPQQAKQERRTNSNMTPKASEQGLGQLKLVETSIERLEATKVQVQNSELVPASAASKQPMKLIEPALTQASDATGQLVGTAKLALAPKIEGSGTAHIGKERDTERNSPTPPTEEQLRWLREMEAILSEAEATADQADAERDSFEAINEEIIAIAADVQASQAELRAMVTEFQALGRHHRLVLHADKAALRVQAVKDDGRRRALAHVGIYSNAIAPDGWPWGHRIDHFVEDWGETWWCTLTHQQKWEMTRRFGGYFINFLEKDALIMDTPEAIRPVYMLSRNMPWAEKAYIMEAIDYLKPEAVREGGRAAYMAFLGCESWGAEVWRVKHMLGAQGW